MPKRPKRTYRWALAFDEGAVEVGALSPQAREGLEWAAELARDARDRSAAALAGDVPREPLTVAELAGQWGSAVEIHTAIKQARIELFGKDLSNSAIAYRLKQRRERGPRICAEPGCSMPVPQLAHGRQRYCRTHGSGRARVERHRRAKQNSERSDATSRGVPVPTELHIPARNRQPRERSLIPLSQPSN